MSMIATNRPGVLRRGIATNTGKNCHAICSELVDRSWNNCEASNPLKPCSALCAEGTRRIGALRDFASDR